MGEQIFDPNQLSDWFVAYEYASTDQMPKN